jgi:hypothetical protein
VISVKNWWVDPIPVEEKRAALGKRPEPRCSADAAGIAVLCGKKRRIGFLAEDVLL